MTRPFAAKRPGELTLAFAKLDLKPWLAYLPAGLPLQLKQARLSSDLRLRFALPAEGSPSVSLQGGIQLDGVALAELKVDGAELQLARDANGRLKLQLLSAAAATAPTRSPTAAAPAEPWQISLDALRLSGGRVH